MIYWLVNKSQKEPPRKQQKNTLLKTRIISSTMVLTLEMEFCLMIWTFNLLKNMKGYKIEKTAKRAKKMKKN